MEAFSLLKYWRRGGGDRVSIVTGVDQNAAETDTDDGPFFDLEFSVPDEEEDIESREEGENDESNGGNESDSVEIGDGTSNNRTDSNLSLSPDDLFFKGKLEPIEPSTLVLKSSEPNSKLTQFHSSFLKSATKFRVFTLRLKKSRSSNGEKTGGKIETRTESNGSEASASEHKQQEEGLQKKKCEKQKEQQKTRKKKQGKSFTVNLKVEKVPIASLFTADNSSRVSSENKSQKQSTDEVTLEEKRFSKEVMQKYLKMVKPLYIHASKRHGPKPRFSGQLNLNGLVPKTVTLPLTTTQKLKPAKSSVEKSQIEPEVSSESQSILNIQKQGNLQAGFRVVRKHLRKSRSASSAVAATPAGTVSSRRHDDSLVQQEDGIHSAILHCKSSFNFHRGNNFCHNYLKIRSFLMYVMCEIFSSQIPIHMCYQGLRAINQMRNLQVCP